LDGWIALQEALVLDGHPYAPGVVLFLPFFVPVFFSPLLGVFVAVGPGFVFLINTPPRFLSAWTHTHYTIA
jgi:hypothetical protein